jgi:hypothetical protein
VELYESSWDAVTPHVVKAKEFAHPYYQVPVALPDSRICTIPHAILRAEVG